MQDPHTVTQHELEAYLDEALPVADMARVESALRADPDLLQRLGRVNARRDTGTHSIAAIWRRHRLTCPSREQLGAMILGTLSDEEEDYIDFHTREVGCRLCLANLEDLRNRHAEAQDMAEDRRRRYFRSSAGFLRGKQPPSKDL